MDVIKTSLIVGIGLTLYYLLLQWPNEVGLYSESPSTYLETEGKVDSEYSLTEPLSPLSPLGENKLKSLSEPVDVFEIENDEKWKGTFVGYPIHSEERKPYCIKFIEYPYGNHIWIHAYNYFYQITFPFLKQVRNFEKTTLVKLLCKQEDIPTELEFIIINIQQKILFLEQ